MSKFFKRLIRFLEEMPLVYKVLLICAYILPIGWINLSNLLFYISYVAIWTLVLFFGSWYLNRPVKLDVKDKGGKTHTILVDWKNNKWKKIKEKD